MKYYHGYWPVLTIIKQYLLNVRKQLEKTVKAEMRDPGLPGKTRAQKKPHKCHSNGSDEETDEELKVGEEKSEDGEESNDTVEENFEDDVDSEDDRAKMEMYEYYGLVHKNDQEDDHRPRSDHRKPVKKSVEYQLFPIYLSLTCYCTK